MTLSKTGKSYDPKTYWKKYAPRSSHDNLCEGTKKDGTPCQRLAEPGARFCFYHGKG